MSRYFVTVYARSADDLRRLQEYGLDLFPQTAKQQPTDDASHSFTIEGLLTADEAGTLVGKGYQVRLEDTVEARSNSGQPLEFGDWLAAMQPTLATDKRVR